MTPKDSRTSRRVPIAASLVWALAIATIASPARADSPSLDFAIGSAALSRHPFAPAGRVSSREMAGAFLGVDGGWSIALPSQSESATGALGFGARVGYAWRRGLSIQARYDYLGVHPTLGDETRTPLQIGSFGLRYAAPFVLMPFGEALVGAAFDGVDPRFTAGAGIGLAIPVAPHVTVEGAVRDWLIPAREELRQVVVFRFGVTIGFGGP